MGNNKLMQRSSVLYIVFIGAVASFLRLYRLGSQALFFDESTSWIRSQLPLRDLLGILNYKNHVPLYFFLLKIYLKLVPGTEAGLRFFSVIFSLLSLILLMRLTYRYWGINASLFAGWLMAISSFEIYYAQETRMYTMLSFFWLVSLGLLILAISGKSKLLIPWAINSVLLSYVQATGLVLAAVHSVIIGGLWLFGIIQSKRYPALALNKPNTKNISFANAAVLLYQNSNWVLFSGLIVAIGVLPIVWTLLFTDNWQDMGGGAWVPRIQDFPVLFNLVSVGLTAGRQAFLDSLHLVFPFYKPVPTWGWFLIGLIVAGLAFWGCAWGWKTDQKKRLLISIIVISLLAPPIMVWLLGRLLNQNTWAYKSFLPNALLFYMLVGIGFSQIQNKWLRRLLVPLTLGITLLSLVPYFTIWQKSDSRLVFSGISGDRQNSYIVLEKSYLSPLAHYYLGADANLIGIVNDPEDEKVFYDIQFGAGELHGYKKITCGQVRQNEPDSVWIYGDYSVVSQSLVERPKCFGEAQLWIYQQGKWIEIEN